MKYLFYCALFISILASTAFSLADPNPKRSGQQELIYDDHIYDSDIRTVQFYRGAYENAYPVIYMSNPIPLTLEFDELLPWEEIQSDFFVDFISCTYDWRPSGVLPIEFYEGFPNQRIDLYQRSEFTKVPYVHYTYTFPKENEFFKQSGNYLLKVYRNNSDRTVVLTRRFVVADNQVYIQPTGVLNARVERQSLDQLRFLLNPPSNLQIIDPGLDLKLVVMQNFRWDNAISGLRPQFFRDGQYEYFVNLKQDFRSGNEFRMHDIRSTRLFGVNVEDMTETEDLWYTTLFVDERRPSNLFGPQRDLNGSYFIDCQEWQYPRLQADYLMNSFRVESPEVTTGKVYVFGELSDWQTRPEFQMEYNASAGRYEVDIPLKQGVYDYEYVIRDSKSGVLDETFFEGRLQNTENYYSILVYYRGPMDRNDRLVGYVPMNYYDE